MPNKGFTLIELVFVIALLGLLAAVAAPKFINISRDARIEAINQLKVSVKSANDLLFVKSKVPSYVFEKTDCQPRCTDIDIDQNGVIEIDQSPDSTTPDVRLIWSYLDNADVTKRITMSGDFVEERDDPADVYLGYDLNGDGDVQDDLCSFKYTQVSAEGGAPIYELITDGC